MNADIKTRSIKGDFIGFTFGGVHSSELGLVRISDGSRYNEDLLPPLQDKKAQIAGRDGEAYFGSQYMTKPIKVPVAFDNMNEKSFSQLRRLLSNKTPQILKFDENPYKQWLVKSASAQSFKWLCFDDTKNRGSETRIYKGEGVLEFNCFNVCANSNILYLDDAIESYDNGKPKYRLGYENFEEWREGSRLRNSKERIWYYNEERDIFFKETYNAFPMKGGERKGQFIYNAGDVPIKPKIVCRIPYDKKYVLTKDISIILYAFDNSPNDEKEDRDFQKIGEMVISKKIIEQCREYMDKEYPQETPYIIIDSKLKMIKGARDINSIYELTGQIYNKYHEKGDYLEIPVSDTDIYFIEVQAISEDNSNSSSEAHMNIVDLQYTHQYF